MNQEIYRPRPFIAAEQDSRKNLGLIMREAIVITGASNGIGRGAADPLANHVVPQQPLQCPGRV